MHRILKTRTFKERASLCGLGTLSTHHYYFTYSFSHRTVFGEVLAWTEIPGAGGGGAGGKGTVRREAKPNATPSPSLSHFPCVCNVSEAACFYPCSAGVYMSVTRALPFPLCRALTRNDRPRGSNGPGLRWYTCLISRQSPGAN